MWTAKHLFRHAASRHFSCPPLLQHTMIRRSGAAMLSMQARSGMQRSCNEARVLVARLPREGSVEVAVDIESCLVDLKSPKTGVKACYMVTGDILQEIHWFKEQFSSWFLGNHVLEDGSLYVCTPVDPLFLLLPILDEARMKRAGDAGKFRSLEEILYVEGYPGYQQLSCLIGDALGAICEVREIGSSKFYRLDDSKVLSWLCCKVKSTMKGLDCLEGYGSVLEETKEIQAIGLVGDYLKDSCWLDKLCTHLGVGLQGSRKVQEIYESSPHFYPKAKSREEKDPAPKSKTQKKSSIVGMKKVTQFFAIER